MSLSRKSLVIALLTLSLVACGSAPKIRFRPRFGPWSVTGPAAAGSAWPRVGSWPR